MPATTPELLAPAGTPAAFHAALAAGADAIYCALGSAFNARRGADNFSEEEFGTACRAAHLAGARVYLTSNVIIREDEMDKAISMVRRAWLLGADACIVQDWGLLTRIRKEIPELECHISTQANIHDTRGLAWCRGLGARRVTLSRELSLEEIEQINSSEHAVVQAEQASPIELEVFAHGALCFCYSGVCMMSSLRALGDNVRSANRGLCAQPCRLPYDLVNEAGEILSLPGYEKPLCPKDANTISDLDALADCGVDSLKIEGRMKSADYVYSVVSVYREALDAPERDAKAIQEWDAKLRRAFNRDFTDAYLHGRSGNEMMSYERSNNRGKIVGEVHESHALGTRYIRKDGTQGGRARGKRITPAQTIIELSDYVEKGDLLEIRPKDRPEQFLTALVRKSAKAHETIEIQTVRPMPKGSTVRLIRSQRALDKAARIEGAAQSGASVRRRGLVARVVAKLGKPLYVELVTLDGLARSHAEGSPVQAARTRELSADDLREHVGRMGSTPFEMCSCEVELDPGVGVSFSEVHEVRARACEALSRTILEPWSRRSASDIQPSLAGSSVPCTGTEYPPKLELCAKARTPEAAYAALEAGADKLYVDAAQLASHRSWPKGCIPVLPEICRESDHELLDAFVRRGEPVAVGNISSFELARLLGAKAEILGSIPVHNSDALSLFEKNGAAGLWFSPEITLEEMRVLCAATSMPCGVFVYGRERLMSSEHCVLQVAGKCTHSCATCELRKQRLYLRDEEGELMPVESDLKGRSKIYLSRAFDAAPEMNALRAAGIVRYMVDGSLLSPQELAVQIGRFRDGCAGVHVGRESSAHTGHLFRTLV